MLELTATEAIARIRAGDLDPADLWRAYRDRAAADDLNAFTWVSADPEPPEEPPGTRVRSHGFCTGP